MVGVDTLLTNNAKRDYVRGKEIDMNMRDKIAVSVTLDKDYEDRVCRSIWFWQVRRFKKNGWTVVKYGVKSEVERKTRLEDFIYGDYAKPFGLALWCEGTKTDA